MAADNANDASWENRPSMLDRAVQRRLMNRHELVVDEVRRMLTAGVDLMRNQERPAPPRVADIVAAAGASNDAFYRAFGSRDEFLAAIVDDGARRLLSYVRYQRDGADEPLEQLRRGLNAILKQASDVEVARTTRAVLACAPGRRRDSLPQGADLADDLGQLYEAPLRALGSPEPRRDGRVLALAAFGEMERALWAERKPGKADVEYLLSLAERMGNPATAGGAADGVAKRRSRRSA
jgi:AcrR family transcriptional regulator